MVSKKILFCATIRTDKEQRKQRLTFREIALFNKQEKRLAPQANRSSFITIAFKPIKQRSVYWPITNLVWAAELSASCN